MAIAVDTRQVTREERRADGDRVACAKRDAKSQWRWRIAWHSGGHALLYWVANRRSEGEGSGSDVAALMVDRGAVMNRVSGAKRVTALHVAARRGNVAMARLLAERGADLGARDSWGETPLRRAVNCGHEGVVRFLVEPGADADTRDIRGATPLAAARTEAMRALLT